MSELLVFLLAAAVLLFCAKGSGYLSVRLGQPAIVGELLIGLVLGPTLLNLLGIVPWFAASEHLHESLTLFAEIGVILLMFLAGLELELSELLETGPAASLAGTLGVIAPLAGGYGVARLFGIDQTEAVFIGLALSATSVSISAQTLMELGVLRSKVGLTLLGAAVIDDVLVVLLLSAASAIFATDGEASGSLWGILVRMVLFLAGASVIGLYLLPPLLRRAIRLPISQAAVSFGLVICLLFAWASEALGGVAAITGAFMAGLFLARSPFAGRIEEGVSAIAYGLFVPLFLVNIGLQANLRAIGSDWWIATLTLTALAIVSKVIGSGGGAMLARFNRLDSLRLGIGMISRGEVGLIVVAMALSQSLISNEIYSVTVFIVIVATLVTPPLLRLVYRNESAPGNGAQDNPSQANVMAVNKDEGR